MSYPNLAKSLLAIAITGASLNLYAATHDLSAGTYIADNTTISDGLTVSGSKTFTTPEGSVEPDEYLDLAAISIHDSTVIGEVRNNGQVTINVDSDTDAVGISVFKSTTNDIINSASGRIVINAEEAEGIEIADSSIGSLINQGTIILNGSEEAIGIELDGYALYETKVNGDLTNSGTIDVTGGEESTGILMDGGVTITGDLVNSDTGTITATSSEGDAAGVQMAYSETYGLGDDTVNISKITGDFINSGKITADGGAQGIGILLEGAQIGGNLENSGTIEAVSSTGDAVGIAAGGAFEERYEWDDSADDWKLVSSTLINPTNIQGSLTNSGTIAATGKNAIGVLVQEGAVINGGLVNTGTIKADHYAISIDGEAAPVTLNIKQQDGLIEGGTYAIHAVGTGNSVNLEMAGGTIRGNVLGVVKTDVTGKATFAGGQLQTGALSLSDKGALVLELSNDTNANQPIVLVDGKATFADGSQLLLTPDGNNFAADGKEYILVQAGEIEDHGLTIGSDSALLDVVGKSVSGEQVLATVSAKSTGEANEVIAGSGASNNAQAAFTPFYEQVLAGLDSNDRVAQAFNNANEAELAKLTEQLTPQVDGGATSAATSAQGLISSAVGTRTSSLRGASSGSPFSQHGFWAQGLYSDATQGRRHGIAGYDADSAGISFGIDGKLNDNLTLGVAYSYLDTDVKSNGGNKTDVESHALTLYSGYQHGNLFVDASLTYGRNDNTGKRYIAGTTAKGDYDSDLFGLNLTAGYGLQFGKLTVEPRVAGRYSRVDIDSFTEKGSSAALKQGSQRYEVIELGAGARLATWYQLGQGLLEPELRAMVYHDFAADKARSTSSYVLGGTPFVTSGAKPARDTYEAGIGVNYRLGAVSVGGSYDYIGKSGYDADVFQFKVRYDF